jgi:hypothetical protein
MAVVGGRGRRYACFLWYVFCISCFEVHCQYPLIDAVSMHAILDGSGTVWLEFVRPDGSTMAMDARVSI